MVSIIIVGNEAAHDGLEQWMRAASWSVDTRWVGGEKEREAGASQSPCPVATPPISSQTVPVSGDQTFRYKSLRGGTLIQTATVSQTEAAP